MQKQYEWNSEYRTNYPICKTDLASQENAQQTTQDGCFHNKFGGQYGNSLHCPHCKLFPR